MADTEGSEGQNGQGLEDLGQSEQGVQEDESMEEGQAQDVSMDMSLNLNDSREGATPSPLSQEGTPREGYSKSDRPIMGTGSSPGIGGMLHRKTPREHSAMDAQSVDTRGSGDSQAMSSGPNSIRSPRQKDEPPSDPNRREKDREREERVRLARERLAEERRRKIEELKEQQRVAQENRERQLELRRRKIEELRRREDERRAEVEERRKRRETIERERREAILQRAQERVARYEAWKRSGQKGGGGLYGFGSRTPRPICQPLDRAKRSSSHSTLIRRSPNGSDSDYVRPQRRALSACSTVRRHCCVDINRNAHHTTPPQKAKGATPSPASGGGVRMRENKPARKPRPASVAGSTPSFVHMEPKTSPRSLSTDRLSRADKPRARKEKEESKESDKDSSSEKAGVKISKRSIDRLSTPRTPREKTDSTKKLEPTPKRETPTSRPRSATRDKPARDVARATATPSPSGGSAAAASPTPPVSTATPDAASSTAEDAAAPEDTPVSTKSAATPAPAATPAAGGGEEGGKGTPAAPSTPASSSKSEEEEYKARLAEKRRQAREKAEREAELERQRLEQERLAEEERLRREEEEQRRAEEEALRLAEEARRQEEERLRKAIEAEEQRRADEQLRLEAERKAKEEADRKAKEEAERLEKERAERARKEEEERLQRKKRLEMIMKRVKTDSPAEEAGKPTESPANSATSSPSKSASSSVDSSPEDQRTEDKAADTQTGGTTVPTRAAADRMSMSTPDLNADMKTRTSLTTSVMTTSTRSDTATNGDAPKFKSPLLQSLLGKKKLGKTGGADAGKDGEKTLSLSAQDLTLSRSTSSLEALEERSNGDGEGVMAMSVDSGLTESGMSRALSGDDLDAKATSNSQTAPVNGLHPSESTAPAPHMAHSSASLTESGVVAESPTPSASQSAVVDNDFEQIIDLATVTTVANKNLEALRETTTTVTTSEDLLNFNNLEGEAGPDVAAHKPLIAFEDNSQPHRQDVPDLLS